MTTAAHLARIDALLADSHPFPLRKREYAAGFAGPGYRVEELSVSRDFFDDAEGQAVERELDAAGARLDALARVFTARWGRAQAVDLFSYLRASFDADQDGGHPVPEPVALLCQKAVTLQVWTLPGGGRWIGLGVGQEDRELPVVLYAVLAAAPAPAPAARA
ncbi:MULTISPECIES: hypothetical protein [Kitasatospora]|uniref:Uncharacterized protein n=1 Tax=Kitasatospora cathayae TaxID=3004092 RepID=A0ABY7QGT8_9ACTN|nr:hypothetical protein [Kitasatospora sp. HUAS 3-15]WBP91928.1 hypothetical protein O1G21_37455 [Kitasatospora sp. HUAS 3-15]